MSIAREILDRLPTEVVKVHVNKDSTLYGESAVDVVVTLENGKTVHGTFTDHPRSGFGGVDFAGPKDVVGLMVAKVQSVLEGTAE